jgi:hypothetical protein
LMVRSLETGRFPHSGSQRFTIWVPALAVPRRPSGRRDERVQGPHDLILDARKMVYRGGRSSRGLSGGGFIYDASVGVCS